MSTHYTRPSPGAGTHPDNPPRILLAYFTLRERPRMPTTDILLRPQEAATALGVSYPTLKQWILADKIKTIKTPGGHHRIPESALKPLMKSLARNDNPKTSRDRFRQVSGRNQLVGRVIEVKISGLLAKVVLEIGDQRITSIITSDAAREMQLRKGQTAAALMKATEVMIVRV